MTPGAAPPKGLLILVHEVHDGISDDEILSALPPEYVRLPRHTIRISPARFQVQDSHLQDMRAVQVEQERQFRTEFLPKRLEYPHYRVLYFGFAHHTLALALGRLLEDVRYVEIFQKHHVRKTWSWDSPPVAPAKDLVVIDGQPTADIVDDGDAVLRLSSSFTVQAEDALAIVPKPAVHVHVRVAAPDVDCLKSEEHLEAVAAAFREALKSIVERAPKVRMIHFFGAVPVGLAFRLGMCLKPNVVPLVRTYLYRATESPRYSAAILVPAYPATTGAITAGGDPMGDLRRQIGRKQAIILTGAGVSISASGQRELGSWPGLISSGIDRCEAENAGTHDWVELKRKELHSQSDAHTLALLAEDIRHRLGGPNGGNYRSWLRDTVGSFELRERAILDAVEALGVPILTTNYDSLFEKSSGRRSITWKDRALVERALREDDDRRVVHVHGQWEQPESVVLGIRSYDEVLGDDHAQTILKATVTLRSVIFVGFGAGLSDPNFGRLLEWMAGVFPTSEYRHYRLVLRRDLTEAERSQPKGSRIRCLAYGDSHAELVPFLRSLK